MVSNITEDSGWEYMFGPIEEGNGITLVSDAAVEPGLDREVYYAVITEDAYGNLNPMIIEGDNTLSVLEDTLAPDIELTLIDSNGAPQTSPSLVSGDYSMLVSLSQDIGTAPAPSISIKSADGTEIVSNTTIMTMVQDNLNNPDKGPVFSVDFAILGNTAPGALSIFVTVEDASANRNQLESVDQWFVDAQSPRITVFSPSSADDGSKYLYGNEIMVTASATDDVRIDRMQYRLTYNLDGNTLSLPWTDTEEITWMDDNRTAVMSMSIPAGNFEVGKHSVGVQAVDAAGNIIAKTVTFTVDFCNHRLDGTTQWCTKTKWRASQTRSRCSQRPPIPYVIIWALAGMLLLTMIAAFMVVVTSMRSPKAKKRGDGDDEADEDWMSEFIGTSQDLDMAAITGTETKKEPESERKSLDDDDDDDDPFAVNKPAQKRRRRKSAEPEEEDDDDDEEDGFMDALEEATPKKRSPPRKRRAVSKSSGDGDAPKRRTPPKRRAVKRKSED